MALICQDRLFGGLARVAISVCTICLQQGKQYIITIPRIGHRLRDQSRPQIIGYIAQIQQWIGWAKGQGCAGLKRCVMHGADCGSGG